MQELSADDLDNVSGGCGSMDGVACVCVSDPDRGILSVDKYCERVKWTYDNYGLEIAVGFYPGGAALRRAGVYARHSGIRNLFILLPGRTSIHAASGVPGTDRCPEAVKRCITQNKERGFDDDIVIR